VLDELQRLGCDYAQGFLIARPLTEKVFRDWWASHTAV
jgi:EAL domain-containing protein (putative c-di-GMP-specific phosphodiesterase class I)